MNGVAERVKEETAIARVQSGQPEEWWDCAMESYYYLRNVHDKMADGKTGFEKRGGKRTLADHGTLVECPDYRERPVKNASVWTQDAERNILGLCSTSRKTLMIAEYEDLQEAEAS